MNTIHAPCYDNILNRDTNEGIVKLVTLMVKHNKIVKVLHVHIIILLNNLIPSIWSILQYPHVHIPRILHWSIYEFKNVFPLYLMFT